jgi:DNA ligase (NAD+)
MESNREYERMLELVDKINELNYEYYQNDRSLISDYEFDNLLLELQEIENKHPDWILPYSPTQRVGGTITKNFKTVSHRYPMLSLANTYNEQEIRDFEERILKIIGTQPQYVCELKIDGVAISLIYEHGILTTAATRGDGEKGDDVTTNVKTIKNIPLIIKNKDVPDLFEVRGEIFMPKGVFETLNKEFETSGKPLLANPRNAASGTLKLQDSKVVAQRNLRFYAYALLGENLNIETHGMALTSLKNWGFPVADSWKIAENIEQVIDFIHYWQSRRSNLPFETDGVVIKVNQLNFQDKLGNTAKNPRWAIAFKYQPERACTALLGVTYQVGRTGAVTPVAELKEVFLSGTKVKRATLHNADEMQRLDIHENDWVWVEKSGEIIPKIIGVDKTKRSPQAPKIDFIKNCPSCGTPLIRREGEAHYFCPNEKNCPPQILGRIEHFVSRDALNVESVGSKTIKTLFEHGLIKKPSDLFKLSQKDLLQLEGFKEKSAQNILDGLAKAKTMPFKKTLYALGIRYVGETVAEKLASYFKNITDLRNATFEELISIPEIGEKIAHSLIQYFNDPYYANIVDELIELGLNFESSNEKPLQHSEILKGLSFLISGTFEWDREKIKELIVSHGGIMASSVNAKLNYLVAGNNAGPNKLQKATELGINIISFEHLQNMINSK